MNDYKMDDIKEYIHYSIHYVFPNDCYHDVWDFERPVGAKCRNLVLSRLIGFGITGMSCLLFLPQIYNIHKAGSAKGISFFSQLLALLSAFGIAAYSYKNGYVFTQWGDSFFVAVQISYILLLIMYYSKTTTKYLSILLFLAICGSCVAAVVYDSIQLEYLRRLQQSSLIIIFISKGIQILQNFREQSTGELSSISVLLQFVGCIARVFTSFTETNDWNVIGPYILAATLNFLILAQTFYYAASVTTTKTSTIQRKSIASKKKLETKKSR